MQHCREAESQRFYPKGPPQKIPLNLIFAYNIKKKNLNYTKRSQITFDHFLSSVSNSAI